MKSSARVLPSLSHAAWSGVSEPVPAPLDFHRWSCLASFPCRSRSRAPSLDRRCPASPVLRACPPPCRPGPVLADFRLARAPPTGLPVLPLPSSSMHADAATPAEAGRCSRRSLLDLPSAFPLLQEGRLSASTVSRPVRHSRVFRPAWSLNRPGRPFRQSASVHFAASMNLPGCYQPERQLLGGIRTHQREAPCHGALKLSLIGSKTKRRDSFVPSFLL